MFLQIFRLFLSLFYLHMVYPLHVCYTTVLGYHVFFHSVFLCFLIFKDSIDVLWLRVSFLSFVQSTNNFIKGILYFCYRFLFFFISSIPFGSFLGFPYLCLHCPFVCTCRLLYTLDSWDDNSNIPAMSGSDA